MALKAFISYSHADEKHLERLHKHMAILLKQEVLDTWTDHQIVPGGRLDDSVFKALRSSQIFIALVSPDYIASNYCYEREFKEALERADRGELHIVPVILEPCDWLSSPLSQFAGLPKDGKAISEWTNANVAYLNVVQGLRALTASGVATKSAPVTEDADAEPSVSRRRVRIKQEFDSIQLNDFAEQAFNVIEAYFRESCKELGEIDDVRAKFSRMGEGAFTCTVVNRGIKGGREAHITVHHAKGRRHFGDISYVFQAHADTGTSNGGIQVAFDDYNMFLTMRTFMNDKETRYDGSQAAEALWLEFIEQAGIAYE